jgi:sugar phosphate isomerase/epimerase
MSMKTSAHGLLQISGHTLGTPGETVADAIRLFAAAGLDAAEVIWQDGYLSGIPETDNRVVLEEVRSASEETGLPIVGLTPYMSAFNSLDDDERSRDLKRLASCIADASFLGAGVVRIYAGSYTPDQAADRERLREQLIVSLTEAAPIAADHGVVLAVENHFNTMAMTAQETVALVTDVSSPAVGILYDQANLTFTHSEPPERAIELQAGLIRHVHAKDLLFVDRDRPFSASAVANVTGDERAVRSRVLGDGEMDWGDILVRLLATGYRGAISLEYEYRWHPQDLPDPREGFRRGGDRLRRLIDSAFAHLALGERR